MEILDSFLWDYFWQLVTILAHVLKTAFLLLLALIITYAYMLPVALLIKRFIPASRANRILSRWYFDE